MEQHHGYPFATNFNPEINTREVSAKGSQVFAFGRNYCINGDKESFITLICAGEKDMVFHHEELESLALNNSGYQEDTRRYRSKPPITHASADVGN